jgi:hypothetical protein
MKSAVFWVATPCNSEVDGRFGRNMSPPYWGPKNKPNKKYAEVDGLLFDPRDGYDMFLRNVGISPSYTMLNSQDRTVRTSNAAKVLSLRGSDFWFTLWL